MADIDQTVLENLGHRGESLLPNEFVRLVERRHAPAESDGPGVPRSLLDAYARRLAGDGWIPMDAETLLAAVDRQVVSSTDWQGDDVLYQVGDERVSCFPRTWHDELDGETDLTKYVAVMESMTADTQTGGSGYGVPKQLLLDAASVMGGYDPEAANDELHGLFSDGVVEEDADQHPDARVWLPDV